MPVYSCGLLLCQAVWVFLGAKLGRAGVVTSLLCVSSQCFMQLFWPTWFTKASPSYATLFCHSAVCSLTHEPWSAKTTMHCQASTLTEASSARKQALHNVPGHQPQSRISGNPVPCRLMCFLMIDRAHPPYILQTWNNWPLNCMPAHPSRKLFVFLPLCYS